mgnify:CR=1 FL=1
MGRHSRTKGVAWERKVASILREHGFDAKRTFGQYRKGDEDPDVVTPNLWVECKRGKSIAYEKAIDQAIGDSEGSGLIPIVICKKDHKEPLVILRLSDFLEHGSKFGG